MAACQNKICIITTVDGSLDRLFPDFYPLLISAGFEVVGISAQGKYVENIKNQGVRYLHVPMSREFTVWRDFKCLFQLYQIFRRERFDIIHYSTPKASLLACLAGRLVGDSVLLYTLRGLGYDSFRGVKRWVAKYCEKIVCTLSHQIIVISPSLKEEVAKNKITSTDRMTVLGWGSSKGVNLEEFKLDYRVRSNAQKIRKDLGVKEEGVIIGYAGRLSPEKGIGELIESFKFLAEHYDTLHLLLVGDQDDRRPLNDDIMKTINRHKHIHLLPGTNDLPSYLAAMDIFVLPSYREGFGNVLIEASAMELPVIASDIPGCRDALMDNRTGLFITPRSTLTLNNALEKLITDPSERRRLGKNGRKMVESKFARPHIWKALLNQYKQLIDQEY